MSRTHQKSENKGIALLLAFCLLACLALPAQAAPRHREPSRGRHPAYSHHNRRPGPPPSHHYRHDRRGPSRDVINAVALTGLAIDVIDSAVRWSNPQRPVVVQQTTYAPAPVTYVPQPVYVQQPVYIQPAPPPPRVVHSVYYGY